MSSDESKERFLAQTHSMTPHPEKVTDSLFVEGDPFFDRRDLPQVKYEMIRRVEKDRMSVTDVARTFGFSRTAFYQALEAFRSGGIGGLLREKPGPRSPHKLTDPVVAVLREAKKEDPSLTLPDLAALAKSVFGVRVHPRSVERALIRPEKKTPRAPETS